MIIDKLNSASYGFICTQDEPVTKRVVKQLNDFVFRSCGFRFEKYNGQKNYICVGENEYSKAVYARTHLTELGEQGFAFVFEKGNLYIVGNTALALSYGMLEFVERFIGVRFFNHDETYIPKKTSLEIEEKDFACKPCFPQRDYMTFGVFFNGDFLLRRRFITPNSKENLRYGVRNLWYDKIPTTHNSTLYVPPQKYLEKHPEFYSRNPYSHNLELCYSNGLTEDGEFDSAQKESVAEAVVQSLCEFIEDAPDRKFFMFGRQDDRDAMCSCARCEAKRKKYNGEAGTMIIFLNAVAKETSRRLRAQGKKDDFNLVTFAYQRTVQPPIQENGEPIDDLVIPCEKLHIRFAPIGADYTYALDDCRQDKEQRARLFGWLKLTKNVMLWDYHANYNEFLWYAPTLSCMEQNIRLYAKSGLSYVMNQGRYNDFYDWQCDMRSYVASKLYWEPTLDAWTLAKEYIYGYYGIVADKVWSFMQTMENFYAEKFANGLHLSLLDVNSDFLSGKTYPLDFLISLVDSLEAGMQDLERLDGIQRYKYQKRLARVLLTPLRMIARNKEYYFGEEKTDYETRFLSLAEFTGLDRIGESEPFGLNLVVKSQTRYRIAINDNATDYEKEQAERLRDEIECASGAYMQIVPESTVAPSYLEHAICVGKVNLTNDFFKGVDMNRYETYTQTIGKMLFIYADDSESLEKAVSFICERFIRKVSDDDEQADLRCPYTKEFAYKK